MEFSTDSSGISLYYAPSYNTEHGMFVVGLWRYCLFLYGWWTHGGGRSFGEEPIWGIRYFEKSLWLHWGQRHASLRMPWDWHHVRHEVFADAGWEKPVGFDGCDGDNKYYESYPFTYVLKSGEAQHRTAKCSMERREWRWHWLTWLPYPRMERISMWVAFSDEVGERTGSWKGGVVGTGVDILPTDTMYTALKRMEMTAEYK